MTTALKEMLDHPETYVYFETKGLVEWYICQDSIDMKGRNFHFSRETMGYYNTFLYFQKGSMYIESFNRKILQLHAMGIIEQNHIRFVNREARNDCFKEEPDMVQLITLVHLQVAFIFLAIGGGLAMLSIIAEIIKDKMAQLEEKLKEQSTEKPMRRHSI